MIALVLIYVTLVKKKLKYTYSPVKTYGRVAIELGEFLNSELHNVSW